MFLFFKGYIFFYIRFMLLSHLLFLVIYSTIRSSLWKKKQKNKKPQSSLWLYLMSKLLKRGWLDASFCLCVSLLSVLSLEASFCPWDPHAIWKHIGNTIPPANLVALPKYLDLKSWRWASVFYIILSFPGNSEAHKVGEPLVKCVLFPSSFPI